MTSIDTQSIDEVNSNHSLCVCTWHPLSKVIKRKKELSIVLPMQTTKGMAKAFFQLSKNSSEQVIFFFENEYRYSTCDR